MAEKLKIIPLGGLNEIGKNMTAYEYGGEIIVVDCGMAFPGDDMYGIDLIIPDVSYLIKNRSRIRGLFITHGHEDHVGAIPYVLKQLNMPIYCTRFTAGLIKLKLEEHGLLKSTKLITVEPGKSVRAGKFTVEFIHVNHSIADSVAFAIHTHMGTIVHTGDFKIDSTPIDGEVIEATSRSTPPPSTGRSSTWPAWASWASRASWRCWRTPPMWSGRASHRPKKRWAPPSPASSRDVRTGSSSPPSPPTSTASSRCWTPPRPSAGRWRSPAGPWRTS